MLLNASPTAETTCMRNSFQVGPDGRRVTSLHAAETARSVTSRWSKVPVITIRIKVPPYSYHSGARIREFRVGYDGGSGGPDREAADGHRRRHLGPRLHAAILPAHRRRHLRRVAGAGHPAAAARRRAARARARPDRAAEAPVSRVHDAEVPIDAPRGRAPHGARARDAGGRAH